MMDLIQGDPQFWAFIHSHLLVRENPDLKLAVSIALCTPHFEAVDWGSGTGLKPATPEARESLGNTALTLPQFMDVLEDQLEDLEIMRVYLYHEMNHDGVISYEKVAVAFDPAAMSKVYCRHIKDYPQAKYRLLGLTWRLPEVLDAPTFEAELIKVVRYAQQRHQPAVLEEIVRQADAAKVPADPWSGPVASGTPAPPWKLN